MSEEPSFQLTRPLAPGRYRLRLTPDIEAAERSLDIERILGDEIVMEIDVTPESQRQAPPPKR